MQIYRLTRGVPYQVIGNILQLARANASNLSRFPVEADSPLIGIAEAEVHEKLGSALVFVENPPLLDLGGEHIRGVSEVIIAVDETVDNGRLAGFLQYKPRLPVCDSVSIGYAAVAEAYRRQGVLRQMMAEMLKHYPAAGLDCDLELVPLYERLGFYVVGKEGFHVAMENAPLSGKNWAMTLDELSSRESVIRAKDEVWKRLGNVKAKAAFRERTEMEKAAEARVAEFLTSRQVASPKSEDRAPA